MDVFASMHWVNVCYASGLFIIGFFLAKYVSNAVTRLVQHRFTKHQTMLAHRLVFYALFLIFTISALQQLGFKITLLLGAAGVFTVAFSFASQTAVSNLISGIFLIFERPFQVGDAVEIKGIKGTVESIDLLSTKIKTADNTLVRLPNEGIMKSEITNSSYFKTRRLEIIVGVAYHSNMEHVKSVLLHLATTCEDVLKHPAPSVIVHELADSAILVKLMVWAPLASCTDIKSQLLELIQQTFEKERIEIPFPHITLNQR